MSMLYNEMKDQKRKIEIERSLSANVTADKIARKYDCNAHLFYRSIISDEDYGGPWVGVQPLSKQSQFPDRIAEAVIVLEKMGYQVKQDRQKGFIVYEKDHSKPLVIFDSRVFEFRFDNSIDSHSRILDPIARLHGLYSAIPQEHSEHVFHGVLI